MRQTWTCWVRRYALFKPLSQVLSEHRNNGYGEGNNIATREAVADYHLVLNPDVLLEPDAVA
jgi:GT2 family glycosyltransferase